MPLKTGIVCELDAAKCLVRVQYKDNEELKSYWLPVIQSKTLKDKGYHMPDIGEHVACQMDSNLEEGVVLGAIYSEADGAPVNDADTRHFVFEDGTTLSYDRKNHSLTGTVRGDVTGLSVTGSASISVDGGLTIKSPTVRIEGDLVVTGNINADGDIIDGGQNTNHHTH